MSRSAHGLLACSIIRQQGAALPSALATCLHKSGHSGAIFLQQGCLECRVVSCCHPQHMSGSCLQLDCLLLQGIQQGHKGASLGQICIARRCGTLTAALVNDECGMRASAWRHSLPVPKYSNCQCCLYRHDSA